MAEAHVIGHAVKSSKEFIEHLPPLKKQKDTGIAFVVGFFFGAPGVGLYLGSWKDFLLCMGVCVVLFVILAPTVVGELVGIPLGFLLTAIYGAYRVETSNRKLASMGKAMPPAPPKQAA